MLKLSHAHMLHHPQWKINGDKMSRNIWFMCIFVRSQQITKKKDFQKDRLTQNYSPYLYVRDSVDLQVATPRNDKSCGGNI